MNVYNTSPGDDTKVFPFISELLAQKLHGLRVQRIEPINWTRRPVIDTKELLERPALNLENRIGPYLAIPATQPKLSE